MSLHFPNCFRNLNVLTRDTHTKMRSNTVETQGRESNCTQNCRRISGRSLKGTRLCNHIRCYRGEILGRVSAQKLNQREAAEGTCCYHNYLLSDDCRTSVDVDALLPSSPYDKAVLCGLLPSLHLCVFFLFFFPPSLFSQEHRLQAKKTPNIVSW